MKKTLITTLIIACSLIGYGQRRPFDVATDSLWSGTKDTSKSVFKGLSAKIWTVLDTGKYSGFVIMPKPKPYPDWTFQTESAGVVARLSVKDSNGQRTGWFDKRYVKITSDSTFVILPKTK